MRIANILCGLLPLVVAGCIPFIPLVDYTPEMAGGKVYTGHCLGARRVEYSAEGISLTISVLMWPHAREKDPSLHVRIAVPGGFTVELLSTDILATSPRVAAGKPIRIPGISTSINQQHLAELLLPMEGGEERIGKATTPRSFWINVPLAEMPVGDLHIELPELKINGRAVKIPAIDFRRTPRVEFMAALNC